MGESRAHEGFRSRLARLRKEGAGADDGAVEGGAGDLRSREESAGDGRRGPHGRATGMPPWLRKKLASKAFPGSASASPSPADAPSLAEAAARWTPTNGDPASLSEQSNARGTFAVRVQRVDVASTQHGAWRLDEVSHAEPRTIARLANDASLASIDLGRAVYLDTETSGLGGGAGVYVYMVGLGWFEDPGTWISWQGFLRDPGEEPALLEAVADRVAQAPALVSFFGKSFDRHRLEDKMRIAGVEPPFAGIPHLDLFHPLRRLTRGAFPDAKLQTMERELLSFRRARDLPGALAPAAWFDYLAGRPHLLEGVFLHNHEDVLSLGVLAAFLGCAERETRGSGAALPGPIARRAVALAETAPDRREARAWAERALERGAAGDDRRRMQLLAAESARLLGALDDARALYRSALEECATDAVAVSLLRGASLLLERGFHEPQTALELARRGLELAQQRGAPASLRTELSRRVERLS